MGQLETQQYNSVIMHNVPKWLDTLPTNCLSVFNHFVGLAPKGLKVVNDFEPLTVFAKKFYHRCLSPKYIKKQPPEMFCKKGVLKNLVNFTRKHLC